MLQPLPERMRPQTLEEYVGQGHLVGKGAVISRMVESIRTQVGSWLERGLESDYPVMFVDCVHIKIHRRRSVSSEAFYAQHWPLQMKAGAMFWAYSISRQRARQDGAESLKL